jgi:hypothetical protein
MMMISTADFELILSFLRENSLFKPTRMHNASRAITSKCYDFYGDLEKETPQPTTIAAVLPTVAKHMFDVLPPMYTAVVGLNAKATISPSKLPKLSPPVTIEDIQTITPTPKAVAEATRLRTRYLGDVLHFLVDPEEGVLHLEGFSAARFKAMFNNTSFLDMFSAFDLQVNSVEAWTDLWTAILNSMKPGMPLDDVILKQVEADVAKQFGFNINSSEEAKNAAAEANLVATSGEASSAAVVEGEAGHLQRPSAAMFTLDELASYLTEDAKVPCEDLEKCEAVCDLDKRWKLNYNMPLTVGIVRVLQDSLQAHITQMHMLGPCLDNGLKDLQVDLAHKDFMMRASRMTKDMKLYLFGSIGTVKIGSGYAAADVLGITFFINGHHHDTLAAEGALPAWLVPVATVSKDATFEVHGVEPVQLSKPSIDSSLFSLVLILTSMMRFANL